MEKYICIASDYTKNPGARYKSQGNFSGEEFREKFLEPFFDSKKNNDILIIDLDGLNGYPSSFFEEAFGGIARKYGKDIVLTSIKFKCTEDRLIENDLRAFINQEYAKK